jgi:hypothetical protein
VVAGIEFFSFGQGKHDHWNATQIRISFDFAQNCAAVHAFQVNVQDDQLRPRHILIRVLAPQEGKGFRATGSMMALVCNSDLLQEPLKKIRSRIVVIYYEQIVTPDT